MKKLKLDKPLVLIDLETTGLNTSTDRIVELTFLKINIDDTEEMYCTRINPGIPIPATATDIHGITDEDIRNEPSFVQLAPHLQQFIINCDLGGFGIRRFDLPLLEAEFGRAGVDFSRRNHRTIDAQVIFHKFEPRDLTAAYKKYCGKDLENAHGSKYDILATKDVIESQLETYDTLPDTIDGLHKFCCEDEINWIDPDGRLVWINGEAAFNFGKHKGKLLKEIYRDEPDYFNWLISRDFSSEVKDTVSRALQGEFPSN